MSGRILFVAFTRAVPIAPTSKDFLDFVNGGEAPEGRCLGAFMGVDAATNAVANTQDIDRMREQGVDWLTTNYGRLILCTAYYTKAKRGVAHLDGGTVFGWVERVELERRSFERRG